MFSRKLHPASSGNNLQRCGICGGVLFSVPGEPAAKGNARQVVNIGGRLIPTKSKKHRLLERSWKMFAPTLDELIEGDVVAWFWLYYASRRPDLDESLIMDLMQGRIIRNDRQIREKHTWWALDKENPRAVVAIQPTGAPAHDCSICPAGPSLSSISSQR